jgi:GNAT superfamily N-acetyltransferase
MLICSFQDIPTKALLRMIKKEGGVIMAPKERKKIPEVPTDIITLTPTVKEMLEKSISDVFLRLNFRETVALANLFPSYKDPLAFLAVTTVKEALRGEGIGKMLLANIRLALRDLGLDFSDYLDDEVRNFALSITRK